MKQVKPKVFHVGQTTVDHEGLRNFLISQGAAEEVAPGAVETWDTDAVSETEKLVEVAGRLCYRSWSPGLNPNVTRVRTGNAEYLGNIINQGHFSVMEHAQDSYILVDVSRVLTHELVRHRHGAYSQESMRFVRLTDIKSWFPNALEAHPEREKLESIFVQTNEMLSATQKVLSNLIDIESMPFKEKKKFTSAMRRLVPDGVATVIMVTNNHHGWRHIIEMRTSRHAEEEMRLVFGLVYNDLRKRYPALYQDGESTMVDGHAEIKFKR